DAGPNGKLLNNNLVVQEIRDTGIMWKYYKEVRRSAEFTLWSTLGAGNYNYIMEFSFRGDGSIGCRLGSTGKNYGDHETPGHMHHGCWRIDMDLDDPDHNTAFIVRRVEADKDGKSKDLIEPFNKGVEGGATWVAEEFTRVRVTSPKKNGQDKEISYELLPLRP